MSGTYPAGFDAHTHLDFPVFDDRRDAVCARARAAGVTGWALAGADPTHWERVRDVARGTGGVAMLGLHPWWVDALSDDAVQEALARLPDLLGPHGLGEIGLDHHRARDPESRRRQRRAFRDQLAIARERDLPVALHCVKAWPELLRDLRADGVPAAGGLAHGFSGRRDHAEQAVALGLHVSFGPRWHRSPTLQRASDAVPDDRLLLETDAPDGLPDGSEPADLVPLAAAIGSRRGEAVDAVLDATGSNARRLLRVAP